MLPEYNMTRNGFLVGLIASLVLGFSSNVHAQSPLTVQPSTNHVGVGPNMTNPAYTLDVNGTVNATGFRGDGSQLTNLPGGGGGSAALNKVTTDTTVVKTAAETNVYSFSVAGGTLGANNLLRLTVQISDLDVNDGSNCVFRLKYGGTTIASVTISNNSQNAVLNAKGLVTVILSGDGATNAQIGTIAFNASSSQFPTGLGNGTSAVDSTASQTLLLTVDWSDSTAGNSITIGYAALEKVS